jgi:hypothetical protein
MEEEGGRSSESSGLVAALSPVQLALVLFDTEPAFDLGVGDGGWRTLVLVGTIRTALPKRLAGRELIFRGEISDQLL